MHIILYGIAVTLAAGSDSLSLQRSSEEQQNGYSFCSQLLQCFCALTFFYLSLPYWLFLCLFPANFPKNRRQLARSTASRFFAWWIFLSLNFFRWKFLSISPHFSNFWQFLLMKKRNRLRLILFELVSYASLSSHFYLTPPSLACIFRSKFLLTAPILQPFHFPSKDGQLFPAVSGTLRSKDNFIQSFPSQYRSGLKLDKIWCLLCQYKHFLDLHIMSERHMYFRWLDQGFQTGHQKSDGLSFQNHCSNLLLGTCVKKLGQKLIIYVIPKYIYYIASKPNIFKVQNPL